MLWELPIVMSLLVFECLQDSKAYNLNVNGHLCYCGLKTIIVEKQFEKHSAWCSVPLNWSLPCFITVKLDGLSCFEACQSGSLWSLPYSVSHWGLITTASISWLLIGNRKKHCTWILKPIENTSNCRGNPSIYNYRANWSITSNS